MRILHKCQYATNAYYTITLVVNLERLRDLREDRDLTQKDLAKLLNCSQSTYSRYETGKLNIPIDILKRLVGFYKVSIDYLLGLTNEKNPKKK